MAQHIGRRRSVKKGAWALALLALAAASPQERAQQLTAQMTLAEKLSLLRGNVALFNPKPAGAIGSAGYVPGIPRLGIPALQETDGGLGITNPFNIRPGDTATAFPSGLAVAATFNPLVARHVGEMLGKEAAERGFNVLLGGGVNLVRDPRGGRDFEYAGEDPLLAGMIAGATVAGTQSQHVIATLKHFVLNDQESARTELNAVIDHAAIRESDMLAFEIGIEQGHPGAIMCAYNRVNSVYACENTLLLNIVLKREWGYPGFVMSDWGAVHSTNAIMTGLDQESGAQLDPQVFFGDPLAHKLQSGAVPQARIDDAVQRILMSMIAAGLMDKPALPKPAEGAGTAAARQAEDEGIVLLRNENAALPLPAQLRSLAVIGGNADAGVPAGGGSSQVTPAGGYARQIPLGGTSQGSEFKTAAFDPPSPLSRLQAKLPGRHIAFADGRYADQAALLAGLSEAVIIFATNWSGEDSDIPGLNLPEGQDALIERVAAANKHTVVVLETAGPVLMPWRDKVAAIVEAWFPGQGGADAINDVLFGDVNPSGHLPVSFAAGIRDLANVNVPDMYSPVGHLTPAFYNEGTDVGYRWFAHTGATPLYPFGFGLSYTNFKASHLKLAGGSTLTIDCDVTNTGTRAGLAVPQAYLTARPGGPSERLLGFSKIALNPGQTGHVSFTADARLLGGFIPLAEHWHVAGGDYAVGVGFDAQTLPLRGVTKLDDRILPPSAKLR